MTDEAKRLIKDRYTFEDVVDMMTLLRSENGCPWDRKQTHESVRKNFIEETYEVVEAIDNKDTENLREELGDVLLQVIFHTQMEKEMGHFDINDVMTELCKKLVARHPHIFGDLEADSPDKALSNWEEIKMKTKGQTSGKKRLEDVPNSLPALMRSYKVIKRAEEAGTDFGSAESNAEALKTLTDSLLNAESDEKEEILGKMLEKVVILSKKCEIDPEETLTKCTKTYIINYDKE